MSFKRKKKEKTAASKLRSAVHIVEQLIPAKSGVPARIFLLRLGNKTIGRLQTYKGKARGRLQIHPKYRGLGLGKKFMGEVTRSVPQLHSGALVGERGKWLYERAARTKGYKVTRRPTKPIDLGDYTKSVDQGFGMAPAENLGTRSLQSLSGQPAFSLSLPKASVRKNPVVSRAPEHWKDMAAFERWVAKHETPLLKSLMPKTAAPKVTASFLMKELGVALGGKGKKLVTARNAALAGALGALLWKATTRGYSKAVDVPYKEVVASERLKKISAPYDEKHHKQVIDYLRRKKLDAHTPKEPGKLKHFDVHVDAKSPEHAREISQSIERKFPLKKSFKNATHLHKVQDAQGKQVGLVAITVKAHTRRTASGEVTHVEEHTRKRTKRKKEFALGIPRKNRFAEIPDKPGEWDYVVQDHHAIRAGRHYDLRLSDGRVAHSWALRHLPKPGEMTLAIQQPTHTIKYMRFEGVIPPGYGAGTVKRLGMGKVEVLESGPNKVVFNKYDGKRTNEYALIRTRSMLVPDKYGRHWLLINRSTVEGKYDYPRSKDSYKSMKYGDHLALEEGVMQPKVDGAHALIVLQTGKRPRVFSYRKSKRGDILEYTHKIPGLFKHKVPKGTGNVVLRAEIYLADKSGAALPAERTAGILNSGTLKAREAQKGTGGLRLIPFDIVTKRPMSYEKKLAKINALSDSMPYLGKPQAAVTKDEKLKMLRDVRAGKHPLSSEGVVIWRDTGAIKAKVTDDADVYVRSIFPGQGKHKGRAGGFAYSRTPDGPVVGRVGTGLSDGLREQLWENRDNLDGRVATVTYNKETSRGSLFAPRFMRWHVDKNLGEKLKTAARSVRVKGHSRKGKDGRVRRVKAHTRRYSASAVAHELGHVKRFSGPKGKTRLKRYTTGQRAAGAVMLGGFLSSPFMRYGSVTMRFTRIGIPLAYLGLSSPVLIEEYMASKEGLGALERTGLLTKEEHNKAKVTLGAAFSTYVLGAGMGAAAIPLFWQLRKRAGIPSLAFVLVPSLIGSVVAYNASVRPGKKITADQVVKLQKELGTNTKIVTLKKGTLGAYYIPPQKKTPSAATKKAIESVLDDPKQAESLYRDGGVLVPALGLTSGQRLKVTSDMTPEQRAKKLKQIRHYWKMKKGGGRG